MRKILDQNFWSHGTPLGSLGPLSQQDTILRAGQLQILVIWGPYEPTVIVAPETHAENPKTAGLQCVIHDCLNSNDEIFTYSGHFNMV